MVGSLMKSFAIFIIVIFGLFSSLFITKLLAQSSTKWTFTGSVQFPHSVATTTVLSDGRVLVVGDETRNPNGYPAEIYDPATGTWSQTPMTRSRYAHTATLLKDGRVLVVGGQGTEIYGQVDIYDPSTNTWTEVSPLNIRRDDHTATLLTNGRVLIAGGYNLFGQTIKSAEIYDPVTNTWFMTGDMHYDRDWFSSVLLPDGKVLVAGGRSTSLNIESQRTTEIYDPITGSWTLTGDMNVSRSFANALLLSDGKVIIAGGNSAQAFDSIVSEASAEIYDPVTGNWILTGSMSTPRSSSPLTSFGSGKVLTTGGFGTTWLASAEVYDVASGRWTAIDSMNNVRSGHGQVLLVNGKTLVIGGSYYWSSYNITAELYDPRPYVYPLQNETINEGNVYAKTGLFADSDSKSWTGTVDYGDGSGLQNLAPSQIDQANHTFSLSYVYQDSRVEPYHVVVNIIDDEGKVGTVLTDAVVNNERPSVSAISTSVNVMRVNTSTTASATFTDPGVLDGPFAVEWVWGDGMIDSEQLTPVDPRIPVSLSKEHVYTVAGVYSILLKVTDKDGGQGSSEYQYVSVFDPISQGLFSAGQRLISPSGAFAQDPNLTGDVFFGLSYKYQGDVPVGYRQFSLDFRGANFSFNATTILSLVISNGTATLRGTGTINGSGSYNFMVVGSEGDGTIRIQIKNQSGNTVYDTQSGAADNANPTTLVTAGKILAH